MKKVLLPKNKNVFKANLNCHTSLSNGNLTAEQLKAAYIDAGYSIVAFSDLDVLCAHNELADDNFLPILSYETEIYELGNKPKDFLKCYSLTLYAKDKNNSNLVHTYGEEYSQDYINEFIKRANNNGFLVCLNHPAKSLQNYADYDKLEGLFALEIEDYSGYIDGHIEQPSHVYDRMLRYGNTPLFAVAADSNKNLYGFDDARNDSFGAWIEVNADNLNYETVMKALENGDFYATTGPKIKELYCENGEIHIKTTPVHSIRFLSEGRDGLIVTAPKGETVCEAVFPIEP
ncbi:MAG: PHP domain-containing protein, partial [Clostridia bacterium]|nr:PHP domain-containing protein [Clostridia bacterium]